MKVRSAIVGMLSLSLASFAVAGIDLVTESNLPAKKKLVAAVEEATEDVIETRVFSKATASSEWTIDVCETEKTEAACEDEAPLKEELEIWTAITTDCNGNGISDASDISAGAMDADGDGVPDSCEFAIGDLNLNGVIDQQDLSILLGWWGIANPLYGDLNGDNKVDGTDMGIMLGRYGAVVY
jgi:hypothetical protein